MTTIEALTEFHAKMNNIIDKKNSWGKNEIGKAFEEAYRDLLLALLEGK